MGRKARGCNSATCGRVSGIVCPFCARARGRVESSSTATLKFRSTPYVMEDGAFTLEERSSTFEPSCTDFCDNIRMKSAFHSSDTFEDNDTSYCYSDVIDNLTTAPADTSSSSLSSAPSIASTSTAFITTSAMSCREGHCSSSLSSSSTSSSPSSLSSSTSSSVSALSSSCDHCLDERMSTHTCKIPTTCRHTQSRGNPHHHHRWSKPRGWLSVGLAFMLALACFSSPAQAHMSITAFEYQRKFHKPLDLGECPQREVAVDMGNNTFHIEEQRCSLHQRGTIRHLPRELSDSRNAHITSESDIVGYLGLCGGEAASFLGILNSGDCVAVEIASRLKFDDKTLVRAFVGYYRKSCDILESNADNHVTDGMSRYYMDKFYLQNRSYGTMEIIFVQFRFRSAKDTQEAQKVQLSTPVMSQYMKAISERVGVPTKVMVINLSTATQETYEVKQFKKDEWERAVRHVEILELTIQMTREKINSNAINPHLQYQLEPFLANRSFRLADPKLWEATSMLEVQLRQAVALAKKTSRKCRGNKTKLCRRVRELRRKLVSVQAEIHKGRSNWVSMSMEEKNSFAARYTAQVKSYSSVTKSLAKNVRQMRRKEKLERLNRKRNKLNQIPVHTEERISGRQKQSSIRRLRIRHARHRNKNKNRNRNRVRRNHN